MHRTSSRARRGTAYAFFLMTALLVSIIGMAGLTAANLGLRVAVATNERIAARTYTRAGVELALVALYRTSNWRDSIPADTWSAPVAIGDGTAAWKIKPLVGTDFTSDRNGGVRVYGRGVCGNSTWLYSARVQPPSEQALQNSLANGDFESGQTTPWTTTAGDSAADSLSAHNGAYGFDTWSRVPGDSVSLVLGSLNNGGTYELTCYLRLKQGNTPVTGMSRAWLEVTSSDGVQQFEFFNENINTIYNEYRGKATPMWTGSFVSARLVIDNASSYWFWIDDVALYAFPIPPGPTEGSWLREAN